MSQTKTEMKRTEIRKSKIMILRSNWQKILAASSILAMALHFILKLSPATISNISIAELPLILIIIFGGLPLLAQIIVKIFNKNLGADLLAFIGLIVAIWVGQYLAANLIILMLSGGQALEEYAMKKASFALEALAKRMPSIVHLSIGKKIKDVAASEVKIGDLLEVYPHETCPVDGVIIEGYGTMDESYLTGEPYQIKKAPGSNVLSGAINGEAALLILADKLVEDSRYAKIIEVMQKAEQNRPQLRRLGDQIGAIFAPVALIFAVATFYFTGDILRFLSVLVVATPCPLLIAIPITIISAISISAKNGIIIRDPAVLERLPTCSTAIFDKTGTLTYGKPELTDVILLSDFKRAEVLQMTASLERYSRHPLANAILQAAKKENIELLDTDTVSEKPGQGLTGIVSTQEIFREIFVTSRKKINTTNSDEVKNLPPVEHGLECIIVIDKKIAALLRFRDTPRSESHLFINHLGPTHNFKKIILLSGDRSSEVDYLASLLGIKNTYASQSPEQKLQIVRDETAKASTLFMGDGINDAPALTAATIGIAFGEGGGVTSEAAGAVIMENSLAKVDELIHISESMRKIALQSAIGGMLFSFIGMALAAQGTINPITGALLQEVIDIVAILNALRLTWNSSIATDVN